MKKYILLSIALLVGLLWIGNVEAGFAKNSGYSKGDVMPVIPYYTVLNRPASGAKRGSVIMKGGSNSQDCGAVNHGTTIAVCYSDGSQWRVL
jgi:hypothetical protein